MDWPRLIAAAAALAFTGCGNGKLAFVICPSEVHDALVRESDLGRQRELLYPLDYMVVAVTRSGSKVEPLDHYRWTHSTGLPVERLVVDFTNPTHVSDYFAVVPRGEIGIALRLFDETRYRVQWLTADEVNRTRQTGLLHLRRFEELAWLDMGR